MTREQLLRANEIAYQIDKAKHSVDLAKYSQKESVEITHSTLIFNGTHDPICVPKELFRIIGKLIISEYSQQIIELEKELDSF